MKIEQGHCAAISGAGSGIGQATALLLAKKGVHLSLSDVNAVGLEQTAALCRQENVNVMTEVVDVANRDAVEAWARHTAETFNEINIVFNNAGVAMGNIISTMEYEDMHWLLNINFWGVVHGTKAFLPYLKKAKVAHIANVSSIYGLVGIPTQGAYCASKFAVRGFTDTLRIELSQEAPHIGVSCIHPGGIKTNVAKAARMKDVGVWGAKETDKTIENYERNFVNTPEYAAKKVVKAIERNRARQLIGYDALPYDWMGRFMPSWYHGVVSFFARLLV